MYYISSHETFIPPPEAAVFFYRLYLGDFLARFDFMQWEILEIFKK